MRKGDHFEDQSGELTEIRKKLANESISLLNQSNAACRGRAVVLGELNSRLVSAEDSVIIPGCVVAQHSVGNRQKSVENCIEAEHTPTTLGMSDSRHSVLHLKSKCENL